MLKLIENQPQLAIWGLLIVAVAVCYIVRVVSSEWRAYRQTELEGNLKEQMIQRGMSAREIVQVMQTGQETVQLEARPSTARPSANRRWLWLALGAPVALFVLCGGFMMAMASVVAVSCNDSVEMLVDHETAREEIVDQETAAEEINP